MSRGRKAEIETWVEYLEIFLPWLALFDDRIPGEIQSHFGQETHSTELQAVEGREREKHQECSCTFVRVSVRFPGVSI